MSTPRRLYIYAVSAISLYAVSCSLILLLQNLLFTRGETDAAAVAFLIAVILIGLPVFLGHWLWAQRLASKDRDEQESVARQVFLYGMQAVYLAPFIYSTQQVIARILGLIFDGPGDPFTPAMTTSDFILSHLLSMIVVAALWFYLEQVRRAEHTETMERGGAATVRRIYVLGFSAAGLFMTALVVQELLFWLLLQFDADPVSSVDPASALSRLFVGLTVWLIFWRWAQRLFAGPEEEERVSVLRRFYLFAVVFLSVLSAVTSAAFILEGFFNRLLEVAGSSDGDIRLPISIIVVSAGVWLYHSYVIRTDDRVGEEDPDVVGVRRAYLYLVAGIGLTAVVVGLSGILSVLIRSLEQGTIGPGLSGELASFASALIAGLPVWIISWRQVQSKAVLPGEDGDQDRQSLARRIYLYFFLFTSAMTVLASAVFLAYQVLATILGLPPPSLSDLGQQIAYTLVAAGLWAYHWAVLKADGQFRREAKAELLQDFKVLVVDTGEDEFHARLIDQLNRDFPELAFDSLAVTEAQRREEDTEALSAQLSQAKLIIAPGTLTLGGSDLGMATAQGAHASSAQKLLLPVRSPEWEWAGVNRWTNAELVAQTTRAVKQIVDGKEVKPGRQLGGCAIVGIVIALLIFVVIVLSALGPLLGFLIGF